VVCLGEQLDWTIVTRVLLRRQVLVLASLVQ